MKYFAGCNGDADVVFLFDATNQVQGEDIKTSRDFVRELVKYLDIEPHKTRVSVVTRSSSVNTQFYLNAYRTKQDILVAIDRITTTPDNRDPVSLSQTLRVINEDVLNYANGLRPSYPAIVFMILHRSNNFASMKDMINTIKNEKLAKVFLYVYGDDYINQNEWAPSINEDLISIASDPASSFSRTFPDTSYIPPTRDTTLTNLCREIPGKQILVS